MDAQIEVTLISPAKVGGERKKVGSTVTVSEKVLHQLAASGAIPPLAVIDGEIEPVPTEFEMRVVAKAQEIAEELVGTAVDVAVTELVEATEKATKRAETADAFVEQLRADLAACQTALTEAQAKAEMAERKTAVLEQQVMALQPEDTPPTAETEADEAEDKQKAAPKKGTKTASKS